MLNIENNLAQLRDVLILLTMANGDLPKPEGPAIAAGVDHAHALLDRVLHQLKCLRSEFS